MPLQGPLVHWMPPVYQLRGCLAELLCRLVPLQATQSAIQGYEVVEEVSCVGLGGGVGWCCWGWARAQTQHVLHKYWDRLTSRGYHVLHKYWDGLTSRGYHVLNLAQSNFG